MKPSQVFTDHTGQGWTWDEGTFEENLREWAVYDPTLTEEYIQKAVALYEKREADTFYDPTKDTDRPDEEPEYWTEPLSAPDESPFLSDDPAYADWTPPTLLIWETEPATLIDA